MKERAFCTGGSAAQNNDKHCLQVLLLCFFLITIEGDWLEFC